MQPHRSATDRRRERGSAQTGRSRRRLPVRSHPAMRCRFSTSPLVAGPRDAAGRDSPKAVRPARQRDLVDGACLEWAVSIRRACRVLEVDTSSYYYKPRRRDQPGLEARTRVIAQVRVRYGYRRVHVLLRREGWPDSANRVYRIYRDLGLQLRNPLPRQYRRHRQGPTGRVGGVRACQGHEARNAIAHGRREFSASFTEGATVALRNIIGKLTSP